VVKKDIDPANPPIRPMKEEEVDTAAVMEGTYFGATRLGILWGQAGSGDQGNGN
jgi:hypothetical protein